MRAINLCAVDVVRGLVVLTAVSKEFPFNSVAVGYAQRALCRILPDWSDTN
jgi:hypothetical protein